ncbi:MAG: phosphoglycerate dehydrogenase [Acidobacteria bacterium]|nr:phosphoglycerate dehydrogenase [Acidobacteriota bacterium]
MITAGKILIGPSSFAAADKAPLERLRQSGLAVVSNPYGRKLSKEDLLDLLPGAVGLIAGLEPLTRDVLERSELRVISRHGAGLSNVDLEAAKELGITIRHTPDAPTAAVAELTVGAMISLMRRIPEMDRDLHERRWVKRAGVQLEGKTVLIIGFGRIGRKLAGLLRVFHVKLLAVDPAWDGTFEGVESLPLHEALPKADVISLHAGGEEQILGEREFALMRAGVFILNAGRGALIDESCLCQALASGAVAGAWLDAFQEEPYRGPLVDYPQVLLTPHIGSFSLECRRRMDMEAVENLLAALAESGR